MIMKVDRHIPVLLSEKSWLTREICWKTYEDYEEYRAGHRIYVKAYWLSPEDENKICENFYKLLNEIDSQQDGTTPISTDTVSITPIDTTDTNDHAPVDTIITTPISTDTVSIAPVDTTDTSDHVPVDTIITTPIPTDPIVIDTTDEKIENWPNMKPTFEFTNLTPEQRERFGDIENFVWNVIDPQAPHSVYPLIMSWLKLNQIRAWGELIEQNWYATIFTPSISWNNLVFWFQSKKHGSIRIISNNSDQAYLEYSHPTTWQAEMIEFTKIQITAGIEHHWYTKLTFTVTYKTQATPYTPRISKTISFDGRMIEEWVQRPEENISNTEEDSTPAEDFTGPEDLPEVVPNFTKYEKIQNLNWTTTYKFPTEGYKYQEDWGMRWDWILEKYSWVTPSTIQSEDCEVIIDEEFKDWWTSNVKDLDGNSIYWKMSLYIHPWIKLEFYLNKRAENSHFRDITVVINWIVLHSEDWRMDVITNAWPHFRFKLLYQENWKSGTTRSTIAVPQQNIYNEEMKKWFNEIFEWN